MEKIGWTWIEGDTMISPDPLILYGLVLTGGAAAATVTCYRGRDSSAKKLGIFKVAAGQSRMIRFTPGIYLDSGLYIDLDANTTGVGVAWQPVVGE